MRYVLLTSEPVDVAHGSGTAMAIARLRSALATVDVDVPVIRPDRLRPSQTLARWRFNRSLRTRSFGDVSAVLGVNGDGWMKAERARVPYVVLMKAFYAGAVEFEHGLSRQLLRVNAGWEAAGARRAAALVVPSRFAAAAAVRSYGVDSSSVHVVPEPFDAGAWRAALPRRERHGDRVLCVAHLYARKRIEDLLQAWPIVLRDRPDARLDIAGAGPELRRLAHMARGMPGCYLHGHVEPAQLQEFYARADVFCLPSAQETFGYAAVEAMASGLSLAIADAGALREVCEGAVAELATPRDPQSLAAAVLRGLSPDARRRAASDNPDRAGAYAPRDVALRLIEVIAQTRG